jgi:crotonobetainyl-CoA:carnitine CoA-transferase CaiB-like acyl-CoA transferase
MSPPPLTGIRVLDLSRILAGPWCTQTLGDLGAEIIKVENPGMGDDTRQWGSTLPGGERTYFLAANRNKRSVCIDMSKPEGQELIRTLAKDADIVVENYKYGGLAKYGLDYPQLSAINPRLIYCSISGYGRTGPNVARPGYDFVIQAESGLMSITGFPDGVAMKTGVAISDLFAGMYAVQAVLAAVVARQQTGRGQHIDISLFDCSLANLANIGPSALNTGKVPRRYGNAHPDVVPYQPIEAADGEVVVAVGNDGQFQKFCRAVLKRDDLAADPRFTRNPDRLVNRDALIEEIAKTMRTRTRAEWLADMGRHDIPGGVLQNAVEALATPDAVARDMVKTLPHPTAGEVRIVGSPLRFSDTPVRDPSTPPLLGQHTDEVLAEVLKLDAARIAALRQSKVVA